MLGKTGIYIIVLDSPYAIVIILFKRIMSSVGGWAAQLNARGGLCQDSDAGEIQEVISCCGLI